MHSDSTLYDELSRALITINKQIDELTERTQQYIDTLPYPDRVSVYQIQRKDGVPVLSELICAKAQCLNGMAVIKASQKKSK